jgi:hypothetical protein
MGLKPLGLPLGAPGSLDFGGRKGRGQAGAAAHAGDFAHPTEEAPVMDYRTGDRL